MFTKYETQGYAPECWIYSQNNFTHGYDNVTKAIMDSCNIFFYTLADDMGIRTLMEYAKNFGLGEATGIELPEVTGNMANPDTHLNYDVDQWYDGDTVQAGIGQSDSIFTPLQLAEYCAAIANGGTRHSAAIVKSVRSFDYSTQLYNKGVEVLSTVESADYNWAAVQQGMYEMANNVNSSGTNVYLTLHDYSYNGVSLPVAAKTGTIAAGRGQDEQRHLHVLRTLRRSADRGVDRGRARRVRRESGQYSEERAGCLLQPWRHGDHGRGRVYASQVKNCRKYAEKPRNLLKYLRMWHIINI